MREIITQLAAASCAPTRLAGRRPATRFGVIALVAYLLAAQLRVLAEGTASAVAGGDFAGVLMLLQSVAMAVLPFAVTWLVLEYVLGRSQQHWRGVLMWPFVVTAAVGHAAIAWGFWPPGTSMHVPEFVGAVWSMIAAFRVRSISSVEGETATPVGVPGFVHAIAFAVMMTLVASAVISAQHVWQHRDQLGPRGRGETLAEFTVPTLAGERFDRSVLSGRVTLLAFWASYCGACTAEMPALNAVAQRYAGTDVTVVGVNQDFDEDQRNLARHYRRIHDLRFPIALDDGQLARMLRVTRIPHIVVVDGDGVIRRVFQGRVGEDTLAAAIEEVRTGGSVPG